jgi:hypothetical protein
MEVFGIMGFVFGVVGMTFGILGLIAFNKLARLEKHLKNADVLDENFK